MSHQCGLTAISYTQNCFHGSCCIFKLVLEGISRVVVGYHNSACSWAHGRRFVVIWSIYSRELGFVLVRTRYMDETNSVGRLPYRLDSVLHGIWKPIFPKKDRVQAEDLAGAKEAARPWMRFRGSIYVELSAYFKRYSSLFVNILIGYKIVAVQSWDGMHCISVEFEWTIRKNFGTVLRCRWSNRERVWG